MGKYAKQEWYITHSQKLIAEYGDVPPPWIYESRAHPYSICWRMGGGESHIMILGEWKSQQQFSEEDKINYCKKYNPPPAWLRWVCRFIWNLEDSYGKNFDFSPYFEKLKSYGFKDVEKFDEDFNSDKWI